MTLVSGNESKAKPSSFSLRPGMGSLVHPSSFCRNIPKLSIPERSSSSLGSIPEDEDEEENEV